MPQLVNEDLGKPDPGAGLARIVDVIRETNAYLSHDAPWSLTDPSKVDEKNACIYMCAESIRICGILLQPIHARKDEATIGYDGSIG